MGEITLDNYQHLYAHRIQGMTASEVRALFVVANRPEVVSLAGGMPYTTGLPLSELAAMSAHVIESNGAQALQYGSGQGYEPLREFICQLVVLEGISTTAPDVVITVGSQQALDILARVFINPGDIILAEGPSYVGALGIFSAAQAQVIHVDMDENGLIPDALEQTLSTLSREKRIPKFLYTVPNFHNPAGVTLASDRREKIIEIADRFDLLIIEDNPYGLLSFDGNLLPALRSYDSERVIYLGSFSKILAPGLRTGWMIAPPAIRDKVIIMSESQILCPPMLAQHIITDYFRDYAWEQQIKKMSTLYRDRCTSALTALSQHFPNQCSWSQPQGGFFIWVKLPPGISSKDMIPRALSHKVAYVPGSGFYITGEGEDHLRLSFCFPTPERITLGIQRLSIALNEEMELRDIFSNSTSMKPRLSPKYLDIV